MFKTLKHRSNQSRRSNLWAGRGIIYKKSDKNSNLDKSHQPISRFKELCRYDHYARLVNDHPALQVGTCPFYGQIGTDEILIPRKSIEKAVTTFYRDIDDIKKFAVSYAANERKYLA